MRFPRGSHGNRQGLSSARSGATRANPPFSGRTKARPGSSSPRSGPLAPSWTGARRKHLAFRPARAAERAGLSGPVRPPAGVVPAGGKVPEFRHSRGSDRARWQRSGGKDARKWLIWLGFLDYPPCLSGSAPRRRPPRSAPIGRVPAGRSAKPTPGAPRGGGAAPEHAGRRAWPNLDRLLPSSFGGRLQARLEAAKVDAAEWGRGGGGGP